jgi:hypothetical protein
MRKKPEDEGESKAEDEASDDGKVKRGVLAAMDDVTGQTAKAKWKLTAEEKQSTNEDEKATKNQKRAAEFAEGRHK